MVYRVYVEKKKELAHEAKSLLNEVREFLNIKSLEDVRVINRYDAENIEKDLFDYAINTVFSEPQLDIATAELDAKGGVVFAPKSRDFSKKMNDKAKKAALLSALSKKVADGEFIVVDELKVSAPKTKEMAAFQKALGLNKTALVVMDNDDVNVIRAAANLPKLATLPLAQLSTYEVVVNNKVVMTKAAVEKFQEVNA